MKHRHATGGIDTLPRCLAWLGSPAAIITMTGSTNLSEDAWSDINDTEAGQPVAPHDRLPANAKAPMPTAAAIAIQTCTPSNRGLVSQLGTVTPCSIPGISIL